MHSKTRLLKRLGALSAIIVTAASLMPAASGAAAQPAAAGAGTAEEYALEGSYAAYLLEHKGETAPDAEIVLNGPDGAAGGGASAEVREIESRNAIAWTNEDGWLEWSFTTEQAGLYCLQLDYIGLEGTGGNIEFELMLDGIYPFSETQQLSIPRLYEDAEKVLRKDSIGNDIRAAQNEIRTWMSRPLLDAEGFTNGPFQFALSSGTHTLRLNSVREPFALAQLRFYGEKALPDYADYAASQPEAPAAGDCLVFEAEQEQSKTSTMLYPVSDRSDPMTTPSDPVLKRLNTIGGGNWNTPNQEITWQIDVPETGRYKIAFRYKQSYLRGLSVYRSVEIDGGTPFRELSEVRFDYGSSWQLKVLGDEQPYGIYLTKGTHDISMSPTIGELESVLSDTNYAVSHLNAIYRRIIMVTGTTPDLYRDYYLQESVPGLIDEMKSCAALLDSTAEDVFALTGRLGTEAAILSRMAEQLQSFIAQPNTIPGRLETFRNNIITLAAWILTIRDQSLSLDKFYICPEKSAFVRSESTFMEQLSYHTRAFIGSFFLDYENVGGLSESGKVISAWISSGRDQAELLKQMIDAEFTPGTGIGVNFSLVQGGLMQAIMAGKAPDVVLSIGRGDPVNYALRGALHPLEQFSGFDELTSHYMDTAMVPYYFNGHCYAIPETQNFFMMFYRTDVFGELGLEPPKTWDELLETAETLHRNNMNIGLPYVSLDAYSVISQGIGGQTIFPTLLLQSGNGLYSDDLTRTALDTPLALQAFKTWTGYYTQYGLPLYKDDYNRFRTGEMPLVISYYTLYNMLNVAAPEIRNQWKMTGIPGTLKQDGTIDRTSAASGTSTIMISTTKDPESAWSFISWWNKGETQGEYGVGLENVLGPAGRYNPANRDAFRRIAWTGKEYDLITGQWQNIRELPEIPGGYYVSRNIDNAFKAVIYNDENYRETLSYWNRQINAEILRKRREFGLE